MPKCERCGDSGLFLKMYRPGVCYDCHYLELERDIRNIENQITDAVKRRDTAMKEVEASVRKARESAHRAQEEAAAVEADAVERKARAERDVASAKRSVEKYRALAKSVKASIEAYQTGARELNTSEIAALSIDDMLEESPLNCLTVKPLAAKYRALRKDIISVCKAYEDRYTTKVNASIFKLMVLALEAALDNILHGLKYGSRDEAREQVQVLTDSYYAIAAEGNQTIAPTLARFIAQIESLYLQVVDVEHEYFVQRERAREEQRALREQMRQEAEERKRLDQERKKVENEEKKFRAEMDRVTADLIAAGAAEAQKLRARLADLQAQLYRVSERKTEIVNLQNGKAGTVYVISNVGSFGEDVFKIGMTRRLEPQERIDELGNASVPFPFDIHSLIFSQDAVALEKQLHDTFNNRRVNKVNLRKEFFAVSIDEIRREVERIDPTAPFKLTMAAEQYRQSLQIRDVVVATIEGDEDD